MPEIKKLDGKHTYGKKNTCQFIVIHHTGHGPLDSTLRWLTDMPKSIKYVRASCHYLIDVGGSIYEIIPPSLDAWHAGDSSAVAHIQKFDRDKYRTEVVKNLNDKSIGVELHGDGNLVEYSDKQYESLIWLVKKLKDDYDVDPRCILGHEDISPTRKRDPGRLFQWNRLFKGLYAE